MIEKLKNLPWSRILFFIGLGIFIIGTTLMIHLMLPNTHDKALDNKPYVAELSKNQSYQNRLFLEEVILAKLNEIDKKIEKIEKKD